MVGVGEVDETRAGRSFSERAGNDGPGVEASFERLVDEERSSRAGSSTGACDD